MFLSPSRSRRNQGPPFLPGWAKWRPSLRSSPMRASSQPSPNRCGSPAPALGSHALIDFVAVLIGYVLSGEPTLLAFYERLAPFTEPFMALFGRNRLPHRSTLSRFLAALDQAPVEALRTRFQEDLLTRQPFPSAFRLVRSDGKAVAGRRCGWNTTSCEPSCASADGSTACSPSSF